MPPIENNLLSKFIHLPVNVIEGITYKLSGSLFTPRPRFVCFPVTFQCNSRCQMCNIWQMPNTKDEIRLEKIEEVFSNSLFKKVEEMVLHGGEPTLRKDIKEIYRIVVSSCPKLKMITSSSNGLNPELLKKRVDEILSVVDSNSVKLTFTVSVDGLKKSHEMIRGIPGGFDRAMESIEVLKEIQNNHPIDINIITVIQPQNIDDLTEMQNLAREMGVGIVFQPLMIDTFYDNAASDPRLQFSKEQMDGYLNFIKGNFLTEIDPKSLYWKNFIEMVGGGKRVIPCAYDRYVLSLFPTGEILPCAQADWIRFGNVFQTPVNQIWSGRHAKNVRKRMKKEVCPKCSFFCGAEYSLKKEFFTYFRYYVKNRLGSLADRFGKKDE